MNSEEFAGEYLLKKFRLKGSDIERYEEEVKSGRSSRYLSLQKISQLKSYHTPDYVISDDVNDSLEDILFVDVSGPKGGLLTKSEIAIETIKVLSHQTMELFTVWKRNVFLNITRIQCIILELFSYR